MEFIGKIFDFLAKALTWWIVVMPWEQGVRVTFGKKTTLLNGGTYLKIPIVHTCFVCEKRFRMIPIPMQTLTTKDAQTLTISANIGYQVDDVIKLFNTLYMPDTTCRTIVTGIISDYITTREIYEITVSDIEKFINSQMNTSDYGLKFTDCKITDFMYVKTYRIVQPNQMYYEDNHLVNAKK